MSAEKPRRLGRGLEALIGNTTGQTSPVPQSDLQRVAISRIRPNPYQPRREFDPEQLADLEASLRASGLLQPITLRRKGDAFELIAGERRLRAATNLGWREIPAVVKEIDDETMLVLALVENLQRADLNPLEEGRGFRRLAEEFGYTHQQIADAIGKDRTTVTNLLRLLTLPDAVQRLIEQGQITGGHARALLSLPNERAVVSLATEIVASGLSVRETERRVRAASQPPASEPGREGSAPRGGTKAPPGDAHLRSLVDRMRNHFQTDVSVDLDGPDRGAISIAFYSSEDFERITELLIPDDDSVEE